MPIRWLLLRVILSGIYRLRLQGGLERLRIRILLRPRVWLR